MNVTSRQATIIVLTFVLQFFFFVPLQVFLNNIYEFPVRFTDLVVLFLGISVVLISGFYVLTRTWPQIPLPILGFLTVAAFVESRIFFPVAGHRPFDGQLIDWSQVNRLSVVELACLVVLAALVVWFRRRMQLFYSVSLFILLFHALGLAYLFAEKRDMILQPPAREDLIYFDKFHRLSKTRNIIHIVTDGTSGNLVHEILTSDPHSYAEVFDGFTFFLRAAGRYPATYPAVSFYMTGRAPRSEEDYSTSLPFTHDYIRSALRDNSIVNALTQNGFETYGFQVSRLYCAGAWTACTGENFFAGQQVVYGRRGRTAAAALMLLDIGLFQSTPVVIRRRIFDDQRWFLGKLGDSRKHTGVLERFTEDLTTENAVGSYNYLHHIGGHPPIEFDENCNYVGPRAWNYQNTRAQVSCVLLQLERLANKLKALGVYDQTMIIVHADHGGLASPSVIDHLRGGIVPYSVIASANPLLLVKPLGARGPLRLSTAPASIGDIPATISDAFGLNGQFPGIPVFRVGETQVREFEYLWYEPRPEVYSEQALPQVFRYRIRGDILNKNDWLSPDLTNLESAPTTMAVDHPEFLQFSQGFSNLEYHDTRPARWVEGELARVYLAFPTKGRVQLTFNSYAPPKIPGQTMEISINRRGIAKLSYEELSEKTRHAIPVPGDLPQKKVNLIEFRMGKAMRFEPDVRYLSIIFNYIGLEPVN
jgi:hypothetical protein